MHRLVAACFCAWVGICAPMSYGEHMQTADMMTTSAVADRLGVSVQHVARLVRTGAIEAARVPGGRSGAFVFDPDEVERVRALRDGEVSK